MNEIVNGWADAKPSFDATEAEAQAAANGKPITQKRSGWGLGLFIYFKVALCLNIVK